MSDDRLTRAVRFRIGDAFPSSSDPVARWMSACCMATNDLVYVLQQILPRLESDGPAWEHLYLARLVGSHLYESANFLVKAEKGYGADLRPFIDRLPESARSDYEAVKAVGPGGDSQLAKPLVRLRNHFFHYAELIPHAPQHEELAKALDAHAGKTSAVRFGAHPIDFRADFADDVAAELSYAGDKGVGDFVGMLADASIAYVRFVQEALTQYLLDKGIVVTRR